MNIKAYVILAIAFSAAILISCGDAPRGPVVSGSIDLSGAGTVTGPVFLIVSDTDDLSAIREDPVNNVRSMITVEDDNTFFFHASDAGLSEGDEICLIAFVDNDYDGGVPMPTAGDWLGFYMDETTWRFSWTVASGGYDVPQIKVNREVFDFSACITGELYSAEAGDYMLIAYAGPLDSLDFSGIDTKNIIGFKKITKAEGPSEYSMDILPYGRDIPVTGVYVMALHDRNGNGSPDPGESIWFYTGAGTGIPGRITVYAGDNTGADIDTSLDIPVPSGFEMSVSGNFDPPSGYDASSPPVYVIIAETDDPLLLLQDPVSAVREFIKPEPGTTYFSIDLSGTSLEPGDEVMVLALWDLDSTGGFMDPTAGDMIGYYQNTDISSSTFTVTLAEGENTVTHQVSGDWKFAINKILYDYDTSVRFKLDPYRPDGVILDEAHDLIAIAVYHEGVNDGILGDYMINDVNYVLGMDIIPFVDDAQHVYELNILNAIDERITDTSSMDIYVYCIYDRDGSGTPSAGDDIAAYWKNVVFIGDKPKIWSLQSNTVNILSDPDSVKLLNRTY